MKQRQVELMNNPMYVWKALSKLILRHFPDDVEMYVLVYHALKLEEEYRENRKGEELELSEHSESQGNRTRKQKATIEAKSKTE